MNENLVQFLVQKAEVFPFQREIELERFLVYAFDQPSATLPVPAKIFLADEIAPHGYGFPIMKTPALDELAAKVDRWIDAEIATRADNSGDRRRADAALKTYRDAAVKLARNALDSSILADYHAVFWLVHSADLARSFTATPRRAMSAAPSINRDAADTLKYAIVMRWAQTIREAIPDITAAVTSFVNVDTDRKVRFLRLITDNPLIVAEEYIDPDLRELRSYFAGHLRRDFAACRKWFDSMRSNVTSLLRSDRLFRRAVMLLGYADVPPSLVTILDPRVQQLVVDHPSFREEHDAHFFEHLSKRLLEYLVVHYLRRGVIWMHTTADGENVGDDSKGIIYSRAIRPMNFGRRGIVEPIVYRFGLVYDITSFTQTLGEVARGGKEEEQASYRQMLEFQRDLAEITSRHALQFEKFLGDGAFYTSRRATRTLQAAVDVQTFYAAARRRGFAFNKGMRIALNYGYYRLLPMQVTSDGGEIKEFYGPGIVELSRLTSGKATKEIEDIQQLLVTHGYDQMEVYRFFAPLARGSEAKDVVQQREFYAYVNENGHLINEEIVASIPFLRQLSAEMMEDDQRIYRLRTSWASYLGLPTSSDPNSYVGMRILGSVQLKGIGSTEVAEVVRLAADEADISLIDEKKPFLQLLEQERNRSTARAIGAAESELDGGVADLVVCQSLESAPVILVGEWDPVSEEVRRPIQLGETDAERYGLAMPITAQSVELQSTAYQKLYRKLSRIDTLPSFSVDAVRHNANFSAFIIGATIEQL